MLHHKYKPHKKASAKLSSSRRPKPKPQPHHNTAAHVMTQTRPHPSVRPQQYHPRPDFINMANMPTSTSQQMTEESNKGEKFIAHVKSLLQEEGKNDHVSIVVAPPGFAHHDMAVVSNNKLLLLQLGAQFGRSGAHPLDLDPNDKPFGLDKNEIRYAYITNYLSTLPPEPYGFKYAALAGNARKANSVLTSRDLFQPYTLAEAESVMALGWFLQCDISAVNKADVEYLNSKFVHFAGLDNNQQPSPAQICVEGISLEKKQENVKNSGDTQPSPKETGKVANSGESLRAARNSKLYMAFTGYDETKNKFKVHVCLGEHNIPQEIGSLDAMCAQNLRIYNQYNKQ